MKVVINRGYGGFGLSEKAMEMYFEQKGYKYRTYYFGSDIGYEVWENDKWAVFSEHTEVERNDPTLVEVVEKLGSTEASDLNSHLKVVEIPDDVKWHIEEYDGSEHVAEDHRTWY